jgi:hypothetical protein
MPVQEKNLKYAAIAKQIKDLNHSAERRPPVQKKWLNLLRDRNDSMRMPFWYFLFVKMLLARQAKAPKKAPKLH